MAAIVGASYTAGVGPDNPVQSWAVRLAQELRWNAVVYAIDPILDMMRTATNVAGQALVPTIVAKREGILDLDRYRAPRGTDPLADDDTPATLRPAEAA